MDDHDSQPQDRQTRRLLPPPPSTNAPLSPYARRPGNPDAQVKVGGTEFTWPVPDKVVVVAGKSLSLEIAVVSALYAVVGLWILWEVRGLFGALGDVITGVFSSNGLEFAFSWLAAVILAFVLYVIVGLLYIAWRLFRGDPVGRGLSVVVFAVFLMLLFTELRSTALWVAFFVSGVCCAVLFFSPWAARVFASSPQRRNRPWTVVLAETIAVSFFSLIGVVALIGLPGLRFVGGDLGLGGSYVAYVLFGLASAGACFAGYRMLNRGPDKTGRLLLTAAAVIELIGQMIFFTGTGFTVTLAVAAGIGVPLWLVPASRAWFGEKPLAGLNLVRIEAGPSTGQPEGPVTEPPATA